MDRELLWITPKFPLPAEDGARIATCNLLCGLTKLGEQIHLVAIAGFNEECDVDQAKMELGVKEVTVVRRAVTPKSKVALAIQLLKAVIYSPLVPLTMRHYSDPSVVREMSRLFSIRPQGRARYVVYDGLHPAIHASRSGKFSRLGADEVIYRAHNREASIWERSARKASFLKAIALSYQARLVRIFEKSVLLGSRGVATVSEEDLAALRLEYGGLKGKVVPIGYEFTSPLPYVENGKTKILFLGRLDWPPNRDGLVWFLEKVWPSVVSRRPDLQLSIAGSGNGEFLERFGSLAGVRFLGRVEQTIPLYQESALSIIPIFYGSGTRVKAIEACRFGRACLSTTIGVEGIGLSPSLDYYKADTEQEWIDTLIYLKSTEALALGQRAFDSARSRFDLLSAARAFQELL